MSTARGSIIELWTDSRLLHPFSPSQAEKLMSTCQASMAHIIELAGKTKFTKGDMMELELLFDNLKIGEDLLLAKASHSPKLLAEAQKMVTDFKSNLERMGYEVSNKNNLADVEKVVKKVVGKKIEDKWFEQQPPTIKINQISGLEYFFPRKKPKGKKIEDKWFEQQPPTIKINRRITGLEYFFPHKEPEDKKPDSTKKPQVNSPSRSNDIIKS